MKTNTRILADNYAVSNDTRKTGLNNNDLIIGNSGAGKTGGYVVPNILNTDNESFIVADTKSQLYKMMSERLREKGYDVYVIDFVNPENSFTYNPLNYVRCGKIRKYRTQDVTTIVDSLVSEDISNADFRR